MYTLLRRTTGFVKCSNDFAVICERVDDEKRIFSVSSLSDLTVSFLSDPELWQIGFSNDYMIISYYNDITKIYSKEALKEIFQFEAKLYLDDIGEDSIYIYICLNGIIYKYNKIQNSIHQFDTGEIRNFYCPRGNIVVFTESDSIINLCKILDNSIESVWRIDTFNDLFPKYNLKGNEDFSFRIYEIKVYNGDFIVVTAAGIARLDAKTGKTVWKTEKRYCNWVTIVGQIGYISGGNKLSKINLETGQITGYGWEKELLPQIEYNGKKYWARGGYFVYNNDLLWHSVNMSGCSFIVAIDPKDGSYVWVEKVDSEHIYEPQFHADKMYITDINGNLFIYQKETK